MCAFDWTLWSVYKLINSNGVNKNTVWNVNRFADLWLTIDVNLLPDKLVKATDRKSTALIDSHRLVKIVDQEVMISGWLSTYTLHEYILMYQKSDIILRHSIFFGIFLWIEQSAHACHSNKQSVKKTMWVIDSFIWCLKDTQKRLITACYRRINVHECQNGDGFDFTVKRIF